MARPIDRIASEREFHDARFGAQEDPRHALDKWYAAVRRAHVAQDERVRQAARGAVVLEYGCADGSLCLDTLRLHEIASRVHGIDISGNAIDKARHEARRLGASNADFATMNAEAMTFPERTFDLVFGRGILHHLDLDRAYSEIRRVLKPAGTAVFVEPLGHNPLINWYRGRTPGMRTPDEHPMVRSDFALARKHFARIGLEFHGFATIAAAPFAASRAGAAAMKALEAVDGALLALPGVRWNAWVVLLEMTR